MRYLNMLWTTRLFNGNILSDTPGIIQLKNLLVSTIRSLHLLNYPKRIRLSNTCALVQARRLAILPLHLLDYLLWTNYLEYVLTFFE